MERAGSEADELENHPQKCIVIFDVPGNANYGEPSVLRKYLINV